MLRTKCGPLLDLCKAHQCIRHSCDGLWVIMANSGCPLRFIAMMMQFHVGMQALVQNNGKYSEPFPVTNRVKQGCAVAPTLSVWCLSYAHRCFLRLWCLFHNLVTFWWHDSHPKEAASQIDSADRCTRQASLCRWPDRALESINKMQMAIDRMPQTCWTYDKHMKTEVVYKPELEKPYSEPLYSVSSRFGFVLFFCLFFFFFFCLTSRAQ